ncbi:hypothetical protein EPN52_03935 [bacterium]|nr:MAG: hypothetical protein EPN52_03935 [bacterium]
MRWYLGPPADASWGVLVYEPRKGRTSNMDVLSLGGAVLSGQSRTMEDLSTAVRRLSSGLRISSAADDPSGLAISERQQATVNGLQTGLQGVQEAEGLVQTADGALQTVTDILTRVRDLAIQAGSDLNGMQDLTSMQTEIASLLDEVNAIAERTSFNGRQLLDGSLAMPELRAQLPIIQMLTPSRNPDGSTPGSNVATGGQLISQITVPVMGASASPIYFEIHVTGYSGGNDTVETIVYSPDPNFGPEQVATSLVPVGMGSLINVPITDFSGTKLEASFTLNNLSPQDVGTAMAFATYVPPMPTPAQMDAHPLQINLGGAEGDILQVALPSVQLADLGLQNISILPPNYSPDGSTILPGKSNEYAVNDALLRIDTALQLVESARAQLGAQEVGLQEQATNSQIEQTSLQAAASTIRDANIGSDATRLTRDQVLSQVQAAVLHSLFVDSHQVFTLVKQSFAAA